MAKQVGVGNKAEYFERLAVYLFFACCAVLSIVLWVFNWVCWKRKCCCFVAFEEYTNKVFSWWLCWVFLCGVLACCIAGFVTANRFGFSLYGIQCAYERVYYDTIYGQQKKDYPKWDGKDDIINTTLYINKTLKIIKNSSVNSSVKTRCGISPSPEYFQVWTTPLAYLCSHTPLLKTM